MLFGLSVLPCVPGPSIRRPVALVIDEIDRAGLRYEVTGVNTVIEGEWDEVMPVIRRAEEMLRRQYARVFMVLTVDDYVGSTNRLYDAVTDIERELGRPVAR